MKERVQELKAEKADGESAVLAKLAAMPEPDRAMGKRLHAVIKASAPALSPKDSSPSPSSSDAQTPAFPPSSSSVRDLATCSSSG